MEQENASKQSGAGGETGSAKRSGEKQGAGENPSSSAARPGGADRARSETRSIAEAGRQVGREARNLVSTARTAASELERSLRRRMEERPLATLATAAGCGYVVGGGLSPRITKLLFTVTAQLAAMAFLREIMPRGLTDRLETE